MSLSPMGQPAPDEEQLDAELRQSRPQPTLHAEQPQEPAARVTRVVYRQLFNTGNYENVAVEAEALVAQGEDPAVAFAALKRFVQGCGPKRDRWGYTLPDAPDEEIR